MSGVNAKGRRREAMQLARRDERLGVKIGLKCSKYTFALILIRSIISIFGVVFGQNFGI